MNTENVELLRKKAVKISNICFIVVFIMVVLLFIITKNIIISFFALIVGLIVSFIITTKPKVEFLNAYKGFFVKKSLESVFTDLMYKPEEGLKRNVIADTGMMNMGDRYSSNDLIYGKYKDINVIQADVHIEEKYESTDSNGHTTTNWVTLFLGRWMIFDFNKSFKANIQVCQKGFGNSRLGNWGDKKYSEVMMEDQSFNNQFRIFAQSDHEAFYILTPHLMEKIKNLANSLNGKILLCFVDNKLHVGVQNNKDSFEHSIYKKINEEEVLNNISKDIKLITNFIDELDLDNDLFRKEV